MLRFPNPGHCFRDKFRALSARAAVSPLIQLASCSAWVFSVDIALFAPRVTAGGRRQGSSRIGKWLHVRQRRTAG
jgi:hypothetical protein